MVTTTVTGRADILWRNSATGQNWMYLMDGAAIESSVGINTVAATEWQVVGSGDLQRRFAGRYSVAQHA